ncbi:MAG: 50S ribosomal protein L11 methyltransferase [Clostridia bacterium]|nr:50S ribosomal protein L11 methyltransferase [Clostridia bacterium]
MIWKEITVNTHTEGSELIADAFFSIGCSGVRIVDKNDLLDIIKSGGMWDYVDEKLLQADAVVKVSGFVSEDVLAEKLQELNEIISGYDCAGEQIISDIDDESWYENWKKYYSPIIAADFVVVPKWLKYEGSESKTPVFIDPGMAFGTGEHESTKLCLTLMSDTDFLGKAVVDVGTGSGILGIAAIKKGAASCYMCDIDSVAVKAAKENAVLNGVENVAEIEAADLLTKKSVRADIILANLTADILIRLSGGLRERLNEGGTVICSGIIRGRREEVINAFVKQGFFVKRQLSMGEWDALSLGC